MKRLLACILVVVMGFGVCACAANPAATETLESKIEGLLLRHIDAEKSLAISAEQSQYGQQPKEVLE